MFINRQLISFARGSGGMIVLSSLLELLSTVFSSLAALCTAFIVRLLVGDSQILLFTHISQVFAVIIILVAANFALFRLKSVVAAKCGMQIKDNLRTRLLHKLFELGPAYIGKKRTGEVATVISSKVDWLNNYYIIYLPTVISAILNAVVIIAVLFTFDWMTALVCVIACIGMLSFPMMFYSIMSVRGNKEWAVQATYYADCIDGIQGVSSLKAFNANDWQKDKIHRQGEILRKAVMSHLKITTVESGVLELLARLGSAFSIAVAVLRYTDGFIQPELLVYALFLAGACFTPMLKLLSAWHMGYRGVTASYGIAELLDEPVKRSLYLQRHDADMKKYEKFPVNCDISFKNVSFAYDEKNGNVIKDISFNIPDRTMVALVGPSGSGKSTIAHILAGFYPVDGGSIKIAGRVLSEDTVGNIQDLISVVWQDSHIFYGTVYENILIGRPGATRNEVIKAARDANIHDFIESLPLGYDTILGERGIRFSGGERQRIVIARAFLRNTPIVILDEATSALDRKNEIEIQKSFKKLSKGKTTFVIAHRLATIQNADQICIVDSGKIRAFGTHKELSDSSELYSKLMGSQFANNNY